MTLTPNPMDEKLPVDDYLRRCSREDLARSWGLLREASDRLVPEFSALDPDPANTRDRRKANLAESWWRVAEALKSYWARASGEEQIDAMLDDLVQNESPIEALRKLERWTVSEWEEVLDERRFRHERLLALAAPAIIVDNDLAMLLEAEAGLAWQRARALREKYQVDETSS